MTVFKSKISDSTYVTNVCEVDNFVSKFTYNYYREDERIQSLIKSGQGEGLNPQTVSLDKYPCYVTLSWSKVSPEFTQVLSGQNINVNDLVDEDKDFSPMYITQNFSDITSIQQGSTDLKNYVSLYRAQKKSLHDTQKKIIEDLINQTGTKSNQLKKEIKKIADGYDAISDAPTNLLSLRIYDSEGQLLDNNDFLKTLASSLTLNIKTHKLLMPDLFVQSGESDIPKSLQNSYDNAKSYNEKNAGPVIKAFEGRISSDNQVYTFYRKFIGYRLQKYIKSGNTFQQVSDIIINDTSVTYYEDRDILYGQTYVYSIRTIFEIALRGRNKDGKSIDLPVRIVSRPSSSSIECFENTPPPPPTDIFFTYNYLKKNVSVTWDFPVNPQNDIKQFQLFRRRTTSEPFELIAQYGFDKSKTGPQNTRYTTGEVVDVNNVLQIDPNNAYLAIESNGPVYTHVDRDFIVDTEFFETTSYIYSLCAIDAHGISSNYSTQYRVTFDPYQNKLLTTVVCDEGAPKAYPNYTLKIDAFKDAINISGEQTKMLEIYCSPEYLEVQDELGKKLPVFASQDGDINQSVKPYYLLQMINLDNQKVQTIKLNVIKENQNN